MKNRVSLVVIGVILAATLVACQFSSMVPTGLLTTATPPPVSSVPSAPAAPAAPVSSVPAGVGAALALSLAATIYLGVLPGRVLDYAGRAVAEWSR